MKKFLILFTICLAVSTANANRIYVTQNGAGTMDGTSWLNAASGSNGNLRVLTNNASPADTFWVAQGIYYTRQAAYSSTLDYSLSFSVFNGSASLVMYGGFAGMETNISQRNIAAHPTILSGDVGADGNMLNNSRHVVIMNGGTLDGFIIRDGYADKSVISGADPNYSGPCFNNNSFGVGAGLFVIGKTNTSTIVVSTQTYIQVDAPVYTRLNIQNCIFRNNIAMGSAVSEGGGGAVALYSVLRNRMNVTFNNCTFVNDSTTERGGALWTTASQHLPLCYPLYSPDSACGDLTLTIKNCSFDSCKALMSSAVYVEQQGGSGKGKVKLFIDSSDFTNNRTYYNRTVDISSMGSWTGYRSLLDTLEVTNSRFSNNSSSGDASAIGVFGGTADSTEVAHILLENNLFENNTGYRTVALGNTYRTSYKLKINKCTFDQNAAQSNMLIYENVVAGMRSKPSFLIDSCVFKNNSTVGNVVRFTVSYQSADSVSISNSDFMHNTTNDAVVYLRGTGSDTTGFAAQIFRCRLDSNNLSQTTVAPVISYHTEGSKSNSFSIKNTLVRNNHGTAFKYGYMLDAAVSLNIDSSEFSGNNTAGNEGTVHIREYSPQAGMSLTATIRNSVFTGNIAGNGGAMYVSGSQSNVTIHNSRISGNRASGPGGGVHIAGGTCTLNNVLLSGNKSANFGGGVYMDVNTNCTINNTTIADNLGTSTGGGITAWGSNPNLSLRNSILYGNRVDYAGTLYPSQFIGQAATAHTTMFESDPNPSHSYVASSITQTNCSYNDPLFVAPDLAANAPFATGDYHLQPCSPAVNAGNNGFVNTATDLDENARIQQTTVDLGAYESSFAPAGPSAQTVTACGAYVFGGLTLTASGTYMDTIQSVNGCDSVITLNLTINTINTGVTQSGTTLTAGETGAGYQWVDCNNSFAAINGETGQSFTATANGDYAVIITAGSCTDTSLCTSITGIIGLNSVETTTVISVYPNPAGDQLKIAMTAPNEEYSVELENALGQCIYKGKVMSTKHSIDTHLLEAGIYLLKLHNKKHIEIRKVVIE